MSGSGRSPAVMPVGDNSSSHWFLQTTVLCSREWMQLSCDLSSCLLFLLEKEKAQHCYYLICLVVFFSGLFRRAGRGFRSRSFQIQTINQITMHTEYSLWKHRMHGLAISISPDYKLQKRPGACRIGGPAVRKAYHTVFDTVWFQGGK